MNKVKYFPTWNPIIEHMKPFLSPITRISEDEKYWLSQDNFMLVNMKKLLIDHLQRLWKTSCFKKDFLTSPNQVINFFLSMSVDGTRLGKSISSSCITFIWRMIWQEQIFHSEKIGQVTSPLPWIIANDVEKKSVFEYYEGILIKIEV